MEQIMNYVKPELVVVAIVLYFIGMWLKKAETVTDKIYSYHPWSGWNCDLWNLCSRNL